MATSVERLQQQRDDALRRAEVETQRLASLHRVIELISSELALEPLLTGIVESAVDLLGAQYGAIGLVKERGDGPVVHTVAAVNMPPCAFGMDMARDGGLAGKVLREQRPVRLDRYGDLEQPTILSGASAERSTSCAEHTVIGIPIWWAQRMIGCFGIGAAPPRRFGEQDVETLALIAHHAAIAIEHAQRYEQEQRRNERLALIARIGHIMTADLLLDELLQNIVDAIHELLGYAHVSLALVDATDPATLMVRAINGSSRPVIQQGPRLSTTAGIMGAAVQARGVELVNDVASDPRYIPFPGVEGIRAELAVPILHGNYVLGVLDVASVAAFAAEEVASLQIIADQLAIALENARLRDAEKRRVARITTINRIGQLITRSPSLEHLLQTAVDAISEYLQYHNIALLLVDPDDPQTLVLRARSGMYAEHMIGEYRQRSDQGIIGAAARARQRILVTDVQGDPRYIPIPEAHDIYTEIAVPIVVGDRLLGVLNIESPRYITEEDAAGFEIIADQFGAALENARLFGGLQQALETTQLLYATSQRLSTAMSVDEVIAAYLEQVAMRDQCACSIILLDFDHLERPTALSVRGRWSPQEGMVLEEIRWPFVQSPFTALLEAGRTVTFADVQAEPDVREALRQMPAHDGRLALALIPLMMRGRWIGMVALSYPFVYEWLEADLQPYQVTAVQLATAIDSRQQYVLLAEQGQRIAVLEERRRLARELHDSVTQSLFSMSLLAQVIPDLWAIDRDEALQSLEQVRDLTRGALAEMRALLFELRPADLGEQSLAQALKHHAAAFERRTGITVTVEIKGEIALPDEVAQALLRIAQEALTNVARHAHAQRVYLLLQGGRPTRLLVADNGQGFDPDHVGDSSFGLISMRERATNINARFQVRSAPGQGTEIVVEWPGWMYDR